MLIRWPYSGGPLVAPIVVLALWACGQAHGQHHHHGGLSGGSISGGAPIIISPGYSGMWGPMWAGSLGPTFLTGYGTPVPVMLPMPQPNMNVLPPLRLNSPLEPQPGFGVSAPANAAANGPAGAAQHLWVSNSEARARAAHFVEIGDEHFRKQKFNDAYARYRDAVKEAPDLAEPYFGQTFALAAMGQYENAVRMLKRGLMLKPDWPSVGFQLKTLYGQNRIAKIAHREALAKAVIDHPQSADLMFLMAVILFCDDAPQRSQAFFLRAKALEIGDPSYLKGFLDALARGQAPSPAPAAPREL